MFVVIYDQLMIVFTNLTLQNYSVYDKILTCDVCIKVKHIFLSIKMNTDNYEIETIRQEIVKNHLEVTALIQVIFKRV